VVRPDRTQQHLHRILHELEKLEQDYHRDRERLSAERDRKIEEVRGS